MEEVFPGTYLPIGLPKPIWPFLKHFEGLPVFPPSEPDLGNRPECHLLWLDLYHQTIDSTPQSGLQRCLVAMVGMVDQDLG